MKDSNWFEIAGQKQMPFTNEKYGATESESISHKN
jgi:hypothetical protein